MKKHICCACTLVLALFCGQAMAQEEEAKPPSTVQLESEMDRASYAIGLQIGQAVRELGADADVDKLVAALRDVLEGREPAMSEEEAMGEIAKLQQQQMERMRQEATDRVGSNQEWLTQNAQRPGVTTTGSGLQYEVITEGTGASPSATDRVTVHYHGTLLDGTVFDSSVQRGEPATFPLNQVIAGWTEGLQLMKVGGKYRFFIPPQLAYGATPPTPRIPPNSILIFEVELLSIGS